MALWTVGLATSRWNARNKSILLMALFPVIVLWATYWQIFIFYALGHKHPTTAQIEAGTDNIFWTVLPFIAAALIAWFYICLKRQDDIIEHLFAANRIERADNPDLYNIVETLSIQLGQAMPEIYLINSLARNAFASSLADGSDRIYVTNGLLEYLSKDEVEAVLAHEYGHILAHDTRWVGLSIIFTNILSVFPTAIMKHDKFQNPDLEIEFYRLKIFLLSVLLLPFWIGFFGVSILRLFLLWEREHDADITAVQITKNPDALMRALLRINKRARIPHVPSDIMFLCIDNPRGGFFATHPRLMSRLKHIARLSQTPIPSVMAASDAPIHKRFKKNKWLHRNGRVTFKGWR